MKHLFIINPMAGGIKGKVSETVGMVRSVAEELGEPFEIYVTKRMLDAHNKIKAEAELRDRLNIYACGGDGTLNECVNGAAGLSHLAVTHYPCGTGNDFIRMFGKSDVEKFRDLRALANGTVRPIDLIYCNGRYSINICSVGIDARVGADVHKYSQMPLIGGATGYVVSLFVNIAKGVSSDFGITTREERREGKFSLICACNGRFYGGGFNPVPEALPDDGVIEFLIVKGVSRIKAISIIKKFSAGRYRELGDYITHIRGDSMRIDSASDFVVNIDGEQMRTKSLDMRLVPKGINFIFPSDMDFFERNCALDPQSPAVAR